ALEPSTYRDACVTQLFYLCNLYHDRMYALGFDEAAGNFQTLNFSGQGTGNDRIQCDAQDGSGTNNANWSSSGVDGEPDGTPPRTQMYVFTGPTPDRDGSFDADIVFHEFSHGLSIRLHDGRLNAANQEGGMGEGWSDFYGLCLNAQPDDDFNGVYAAGAYATLNLGGAFTNNYYFGIRRFPYSTDLNKNPLTYADLDPAQNSYPPGIPRSPVIGNTANEVHNVGELWCMTLLECREQMGRTMGFAANEMIMRLAVDGMKLNTAANLNFLNSRDAILQADLVSNAAANHAAIWAGFAKRGQGTSATSPATATTGIVEAFDTPIRVTFTFPSGTPAQLQPGVATSFNVDLDSFGLTITPNTGQLHYRVNGGAFQIAPMTVVDSNTYSASIPGVDCFQSVDYYVSVDTSVGRRSFPDNAPASSFSALVFQSVDIFASDNFEADRGWTVGPNTATAGVWTRVDPVGTIAQPEDDVSNPGTLCWVTGQGAVGGALGAADLDNGNTILTSPAYDLSGQPDATVSYSRWYDNSRGGAPGADVFTVQVSSNNGASWTNAEVVGPSGTGTTGGWVRAEWTLSSLGITPTSQVRVRFIADDSGTGSIVEAALDEFSISRLVCVGQPSCPADWNGDGSVDGDDVIGFFTAWDAGNADFDNNGSTDGDDVIEFFNRWDANC
ncbi:MAG: M36 family metallopeptidase, partial [Phycisphaerales bacterium]